MIPLTTSFHKHPSIKMIKNKVRKIAKFSFQQVTLVDVRKAIKDIRLDKSWTGDIPADILKQRDLFYQALTNFINQSIVSGKFPDSLKLANVSPIYKAKDPLDRTNNYRPVSVLPLLSKIYERLIFEQYLGIPTLFWVNYCVVLENLIARNMLSLDYFSHGKRRLTTQNMLAQCSWIC